MRAHQPRVLFLLTFSLSLFLVACFGGHGGGGGGGGGGTPTPKLRVDFTGGPFTPNQIGASYTLTVRNKGDAATSGTVTLTDPPNGMIVTSIVAPNWTCVVLATTCSRGDSLAPGASYDPITVVGTVTAPAGGTVSATVTVTGGGAAAFSGSGSIPVNSGATGGAVSLIQPGVLFPQLVAGSKLSLQATVNQGDNGSGVNWGVQAGDTCSANGFISSLGTQGGSASLGTVPGNAANGAVVTYTAPSPAPAAPNNVFTITALQAPSTAGPCIVITVVATNNSLFSGNYVFRFRGFVSTGQTFAIISQLHADGVGSANLSTGISAGLEDVNIAQTGGSSAAFPKVAFTGGYNMDSPSHGIMKLTITSPPWATLSLSNPPPTTMTFSFTLSLDGSFGGLIETDGAATPGYVGSGDFQFQGPSKNFNVTRFFPSYVLSLEGPAGVSTTAVHKGLIGRLDLVATANSTTAGTIANTSTGDDQSGSAPNTPLSGTYLIDDTVSGHGVFTIVGGANPHVSFYIIRPGVFYALRIDNNVNPDAILLGALHSVGVDANGVPLNFDNTSLNGSFIFNLLGINAGNSSATTGHFSGTPGSSGTGTLAGFMDINDGGAVSSPSFTGSTPPNTATFTISANGRGKITIALGGVTYNFVFYARGLGAGFLLEQPASDTSNRGRSGGWLVQSISPPIVAAGANGTYILATAVVTAASTNTLAVLSLNGGNANLGSFSGTSYSSKLGSALATNSITGTFTITDMTNGRGTLTVTAPNTIAGNAQLAFELYDSADAALVGIDNVNTNPPIIVLDE